MAQLPLRSMPMWRCPHCGTPQAETARCWVCRRSSTSCGTCRHYRRSVAAQLGYCGLDRRRVPLLGDEIRPCWEATAAAVEAARARTLPVAPLERPLVGDGRRREFIEVASSDAATPIDEAADGVLGPSIAASPADSPGWSLWGDLEG
jgi:hypothetical protein